MTVDLVRAAPKPLDFTVDGEPVFARKLPFRLAMRLQGEEITAEQMAEIIQACAVRENGNEVFADLDVILDFDSDQMIQLFQAVSGAMVTSDQAGKNSKASRP